MPRFSLSDDFDDDDEIEPPHPVGFGSQWDRNSWIGLDPGRCTYALDDQDIGDEFTFMTRGSFPPLSAYISRASTPIMLKYRGAEEKRNDDEDDVLALQELLRSQSITSPRFTSTPTLALPPNASLQIAQKMELERRRMEQEHLAMTQGVQSLLLDLDRQTAAILKERQDADTARQEHELALKKQQLRQEEDARKKKQEERAKEQAKVDEQAQVEQQGLDDKKRREDLAAAKTEYVAKARKLVAQLVQVRESIEPFDKNKAISKRRLGMKKIVGGRINTLAENVEKIQQVATEVGQAIAQARHEDEQIKQALERKDPGYTPDMARGKRYLVDLLASNTIQRIQADGFNGPRGDGFPLASMLAMVSVDNKELVPILAAHVYTVCPTAIPTLPSPKKDATEDELMESLGMQKDKHGEYETFDKFLNRTESIVTFVSNIMASLPSSHALFGGHMGAVKWLERFLDLLPGPPAAPLPLLTAPVLHGFLSGAGHMLANKHSEIFQNQVKKISEEVLNRLDDGPIGKPSSIRLGKLMDGGLEKFQSVLPERALSELYYGAKAGSGHGHLGGDGKVGSMSFGSSTSALSGGTFKGSAPSGNTSLPFGGLTGRNAESTPNNPFGGGGEGAPAPFGSSANAAAPSAFGASFVSSGFGTSGDGMSSESLSLQSSPFVAAPSAGGNNPFGTSSNAFGAPATSTFGAGINSPAPSPFGSAPEPFGSSGTVPFASPFGASGTTHSQTGFGASPFGNRTPNAPAPSPFGGREQSHASHSGYQGTGGAPFGGGSFGGGQIDSNKQSFSGGRGSGGGGRGASSKLPCKFFAQGRCRFGDSCKFSHDTSGGGSFGNNSGRGIGGGGGRGGSFGNSFPQSSQGFGSGASPFSGGGQANNTFGAHR